MRATEKKPWKDGAVERTEAAKRQRQKENKRAKEREEQIQTKQRGTSRARDRGKERCLSGQTDRTERGRQRQR